MLVSPIGRGENYYRELQKHKRMKISNKNKLIIISFLSIIYLIAYAFVCYKYPVCIKDLPMILMMISLSSIWEYTFLDSLRWNTQTNTIYTEGNEE